MKLRLLLAVSAMLWSTLTLAEPERSPQAWLNAMAEALDGQAYEGRLLYLRGDQLHTLEIRQAMLGETKYERVTQLDGQAAELIRIGAEVVSVGPQGQVTRLPAGSSTYPGLRVESLSERLPEQYQLQVAGDGRVAGRPVTRLHLVPVDTWRFGYRFWLDQESALPLKVETVDFQGQALERMEFISLELAPDLSASDFEYSGNANERGLAPAQEQIYAGRSVQLQANWLPPGFSQVDGDTRLELGNPVTALTFSDGIAAFTLFVAVGEPEANGALVSRLGPTLAVTSHVRVLDAGFNVTMLGEIPAETAERVLTNLQLVLEGSGD